MSEEWRDEEIRMREKAQAHAGEIVPGSGSRGAPRRMSQMVSVRLDGDLVGKLRTIARQRGITLSELLREGAIMVAQDPYMVKTTVHIETIVGARLHEVASTPDEELLTAIG